MWEGKKGVWEGERRKKTQRQRQRGSVCAVGSHERVLTCEFVVGKVEGIQGGQQTNLRRDRPFDKRAKRYVGGEKVKEDNSLERQTKHTAHLVFTPSPVKLLEEIRNTMPWANPTWEGREAASTASLTMMNFNCWEPTERTSEMGVGCSANRLAL